MQTVKYTEQDGEVYARIRGICRKVGKVGETRYANFGQFTNVGDGYVEYTSACGHDGMIDDLMRIGAIESPELEMVDDDNVDAALEIRELGTGIFS